MAVYRAPKEWTECVGCLAAALDGRSRWRLPLLMLGAVFAGGRRTVTTWLRAATLQRDYRDFYHFLQTVGRRWREVGDRVLALVVRQAVRSSRVLLVIDDSPTKRYGPKVEGAGIHHDPTPGPTGNEFCYGHVWVTLAVCVRHLRWGAIGLPIWSWLYVRRQDVSKLPSKYGWSFQTKLVQAVDLARRAVRVLHAAGKSVWIVTDGGFTKRPFVRPLLAEGVTLVGRLRKDSALRDLPPPVRKRGRGRPRVYGVNRISLAKRAAHRGGWSEVTCSVYGVEVTKTVKTFLATHATFGGVIRVVIVKEPTGPQFFYCTDPDADVRDIVEAFADRSTIEQVFHDVKEVWGSGQQQVRNLWTNIGVWHLNLWLFTLTELWAWNQTARQLTHRNDSPWDTPDRRPSHADRRKALQTQCLLNDLSHASPNATLTKKIRSLLQRLLRLAV
jgi:DDE superfamily endonuclease